MATATEVQALNLGSFYEKLSTQHGDDPVFKRLKTSIEKAAELAAPLIGQGISFLHNPIGPLLLNDSGSIASKIVADKNSALKALVPKFMVNQASRLLDLLNLICKYEPEAVVTDHSKNYENKDVTLKIGNGIDDKDYYLHQYKIKQDTTTQLSDSPQYPKKQFEHRHEQDLRNSSNLSSRESDWKYHRSGFDLGNSSLHSFDFYDKGHQIRFQQGKRDAQAAAKLLVGSSSQDGLASWYDNPELKVDVVPEENFLVAN